MARAEQVLQTFLLCKPNLTIDGVTIEDEYGGLEYIRGDLTTMLHSGPKLDTIFAYQLPKSWQEPYNAAQNKVWGEGDTSGQKIALGAYWVARIMPLSVQGEHYTISIFNKSTPDASA
jgi:hypothetical protein